VIDIIRMDVKDIKLIIIISPATAVIAKIRVTSNLIVMVTIDKVRTDVA
jgi:hypothetical protein